MGKRVTTIPATLNRFTSAPAFTAEKRKVAGYARVSTDLEEQQSSYEAQMDYYRNYIASRGDWEFVGMYSDEEPPYPAQLEPPPNEFIRLIAAPIL